MIASLKRRTYRSARLLRPGNRWQHGAGCFAMYWHAAEPNFGDVLSPLILGAHLPGEPRWVPPGFPAKVIGLGSIAHVIGPGDLVVGTGSIDGAPSRVPRRARVLAVRGPRTAVALGLRGDVRFGDPGLLAAAGLPPAIDRPVEGRIALVPHHAHRAALEAALATAAPDRDRVRILDVHGDPQAVIDGVAEAETVVSSALHGLIVAEALGRPAVWIELGAPLLGGRFKFHDHFEATGRSDVIPVDLARGLAIAEANEADTPVIDRSGIESALAEAAELLG